MSEHVTVNNSSGCGCFSFVATVLLLWAICFGLPTPWGVFNIDLLPPRIWQMKAENTDD